MSVGFICYFKHVTAWIDANSPIAKLGVTLEETVNRKFLLWRLLTELTSVQIYVWNINDIMTDLMLNFDLRDEWWCDLEVTDLSNILDHYEIKANQVFLPTVSVELKSTLSFLKTWMWTFLIFSPKKGKRSKINNDFFKLSYISWKNKSLHGKTLLKY